MTRNEYQSRWPERPFRRGGDAIVACDSSGTVLRANLRARQLARQFGVPSIAALLPGEHCTLTTQCLEARRPQVGAAVVGARRLSWMYRLLRDRNLVCAYGTLLTESGTRASSEVDLLKSALANLAMGVLIINADLDIYFANPRAQLLLERSWPGATKDGRLFRDSPWISVDLYSIIARGTGAMTLHRQDNRAPVELMISRLADTKPSGGGDNSLFIVFAVDPEFASPAFAEHLRDLYGFSAAEARVASILKQGPRLEEAAQRIGVSRNTIRTQVRTLCEKTGSVRMTDLLWRLNACAAAMFIDPDWLSRLTDLIQ